jgi:UDP-3-O-[3-hydroxymyristoyl] glucosamine N-acyltransferase
VQIGHNAILGRCCVIVAQVGISGSTVLEDFVRVGGQAERQSEFQRARGCIAIQSSLDLIY